MYLFFCLNLLLLYHRKYNQLRFNINEGYSPDRLHAEIHALLPVSNMDIDFSKITLFIYRKMKSREFGMARPCPSCMAYIKQLGVKNIVYTTDDGYAFEKIL